MLRKGLKNSNCDNLGQEGASCSMAPSSLLERCKSLGLWRLGAAVSVVVMSQDYQKQGVSSREISFGA